MAAGLEREEGPAALRVAAMAVRNAAPILEAVVKAVAARNAAAVMAAAVVAMQGQTQVSSVAVVAAVAAAAPPAEWAAMGQG